MKLDDNSKISCSTDLPSFPDSQMFGEARQHMQLALRQIEAARGPMHFGARINDPIVSPGQSSLSNCLETLAQLVAECGLLIGAVERKFQTMLFEEPQAPMPLHGGEEHCGGGFFFSNVAQCDEPRVESVLSRTHVKWEPARIGKLTTREREVLEGLACGYSNRAIAADLGVSARTVEVHRANVMSKLGARNLADALRIAFLAGLGSDSDWRQAHKARPDKVKNAHLNVVAMKR